MKLLSTVKALTGGELISLLAILLALFAIGYGLLA